jgi:hypothetical protein
MIVLRQGLPIACGVFIEKYFAVFCRSDRRIYPAIIDCRKWLCGFMQPLIILMLAIIPLK